MSDRRRCEFFKWYDDKAFPQYITNLLGDLRDKVNFGGLLEPVFKQDYLNRCSCRTT
ncbi:hypothetical protein ACP70R_037980 [Stipagrostis hirtigluma subsp. patula]